MSENQETPNENPESWHDRYSAYFERKLILLKSHRYGAALLILFPVVLYITSNFKGISNGFHDLMKIFKSNEVVEVTKVERNAPKRGSLLQIFHEPFQFFNDTIGKYSENEVVDQIELANDDLFVHIVNTDESCGRKYVLIDEKSVNDTVVHKLIPVRDFDNEKRDDWSVKDALRENTNQSDEDSKEPIDDPCKIGDNSSPEHFRRWNPGLDISIQNKSGSGLFIQYVEVRVRKSAENRFPLLIDNITADFNIPIYNEGAGPARNVIMRFNIKKRKEALDYSEQFKYTLPLSDIKPTKNDDHFYYSDIKANLKKYFKTEGVNLDKLGPEPDLDSTKLARSGAFGRFKDGEARVYGQVMYDGMLPDGIIRRDTLNFNYLVTFVVPDFGGAIEYELQGIHNIRLKPNGIDYTKKFNVSASVPVNTSGNIKLFFYSGKPSYHLFDLVFYYNQGKSFKVSNIFLNEYIRNSERAFFHSISKENSSNFKIRSNNANAKLPRSRV